MAKATRSKGAAPHCMKKLSLITLLALSLGGCATDVTPPVSVSLGYPVSQLSALEMKTNFRFMPSSSGYYLPPGIYVSEGEDVNGVFFRAPRGALALSGNSSVGADGGIYLPKEGTKGVRGYAYLKLPVMGQTSYFLPDDFFSAYGKQWGLLRRAARPN